MARRAYQLCLLLLPGWFREEFGAEMTQTFADSRRAHPGVAAGVELWCTTARDLAALAYQLHADALKQDVVYAVRTLRRTPAFTLAAIGTLALGLGPTVVIANLLYQVVLAPLPFADGDRLVRVWNERPERRQSRIPLSIPDYVDYLARQSAFEALAAHTGTSVAMTIGGTPRQVPGVLTTSELHRVLGVRPVLGRELVAEDEAPGAPAVMLLGPALWRSEFGGRADIIGHTIHVDGKVTTIVGLLPDGFDFPPGTTNAWVPLTIDPANANRGTHFMTATGRLKPGVAMKQATDDLNGIARGLAATYPDTNGGVAAAVFGLKDQLNGDAPSLLLVLSGAIAAVLLIACLNVASLLTIRTSVRGTELAVRTALGATGRRLRRQLMVEHFVLALAGGTVAAALGVALHRVIIQQRLLALPRTAATFGWPAIAALVILVVGIGAAFAWMASRRSAAHSPASALLGTLRQTGGRALVRMRQTLVVAEVAAALVLLVIAGLMLQSAARLAAVDPGFRTEGVLTFGVVLPGEAYMQPVNRLQFADRVLEGLRALPGVREAAIGGYAPMGEMRATRRFARLDRPLPASGDEPVALDLPIGPRYFEVMGISLVQGRPFTEHDTATSPPVMIVSETFARTHFPDGRALGGRIRFYSSRPGGTPPPPREVVGVVKDVRQDGVRDAPIPQMYSPYAQNTWSFLSFFVLVHGDPSTVASSVQRVVTEVDPMRPARDVLTTRSIVRGSTERHRAMTWMLLVLAALAMLLAAVGLYGVSATAAAARSRELAIRAAVGAEPRALLRLVLGQSVATAAVGVIAGVAASLAATRGLGTLLYEVGPTDPVTVVITALVLLNVAALAGYIPARRALSANPAEVLRAE